MKAKQLNPVLTALQWLLMGLLLGWLALPAMAQSRSESPGAVDTIAAVVNDDVITMRVLQRELQRVKGELSAQDVPLPDDDTLAKQVLQHLITERLIEQQAEEVGITVTDEDVHEAVQIIARNNDLDEAGLRREIEAAGLHWDDYLASLRNDILVDQLRFRMVDEQIHISESEIDAYLKTQGVDLSGTSGSAAPAEDDLVELSQIVIRVPESAGLGTERELRAKAESIMSELEAGADFATLAASFSDGDEALSGGHIGTRPLDGWPDVFVQAVSELAPGEVSEIIRTGQGFHILKVTNRGVSEPVARQRAPSGEGMGAEGPVMVTQTQASHILIKLSQVVDDEQARSRLEQLRERIRHGEDFAELARSYSEDPSAPQGGSLGWLSPGETVPAFEQAMDALDIGEVSGPVRSPFGWHLIQVQDRRERDMSDELMRLQARQKLFEEYAEPAFDDWLAQVRGQAYIENRLDPAASSRNARRPRR